MALHTSGETSIFQTFSNRVERVARPGQIRIVFPKKLQNGGKPIPSALMEARARFHGLRTPHSCFLAVSKLTKRSQCLEYVIDDTSMRSCSFRKTLEGRCEGFRCVPS